MLTQKILDKKITFADIEQSLPDLKEVLEKAKIWAKLDDPIFILGPTGAGKTCIAQAIHNEWCASKNDKQERHFSELVCTNITEPLFESELFGHVKGAFSQAIKDRVGLIQTCNGGSIFLDEISEIPLATQAKLLRVIEQRSFRKVGGDTEITEKIRIICAANRPFLELQNPAVFRQDLLFRLGMVLYVPSICERPNDLQNLKDAITNECIQEIRALFPKEFPKWVIERNCKTGTGIMYDIVISEEAQKVLDSYTWPGNIRELKYAFRSMYFSAIKAEKIDLQHIPDGIRRMPPVTILEVAYADRLKEFETNARKVFVKKVLKESHTRAEAAEQLGTSVSNIYKIIKDLGLKNDCLFEPEDTPKN